MRTGSIVLIAFLACASVRAEGLSQALPPQPLADALETFARSVGLQVVYGPEIAKGVRSPGAGAGRSVEETLRELLRGTGLTFEFVNEKTVTLRTLAPPKDSPSATSATPEAQATANGTLRMVRLQSETSGTVQKAESASSDARNSDEQDTRGVPEILVKGKRSLNVDIQRTEDDPQPYVVFDRDEIVKSQAENLEEFLKSRLPMNTEFESPTGNAVNRSNINLRGLGTNQTLILVDGRRMPMGAAGGSPLQPDLNGISVAMVERIEVLPSTAGGIYGGSATGGVINIVLRRDLQNIETKATYLNTFDTDSGNMRLDGSAGFSLEGGRTRVMVAAAHSSGNELAIGDRDFGARAIALTQAKNPAAFANLVTPPLGATVNIRSNNGTPLTLDVGYGSTPLGSNHTYLPLGYAGAASDSGAALVRNAGKYNLDLPAGMNGRDRALRAAPVMDSASINLRREFTSHLEAFLDVSRFGNEATASNAGVPNSVTNLPGTAPNNPFQQNIRIRFPTPGIAFENRMKSSTLRGTGGLIARLPRNWMIEADYGWSRARHQHAGANNTVIDAAGTASLNTGQPGTNGRPALNALQEGNTFPIEFTPYLLPMPNNFVGPTDTVSKDAVLRSSGPLFELPGGPLTLSALLEHRVEEIQDSINQNINTTTRAATFTFFPSRFQNADSAYVELRTPLISARNALPWVRDLELQVSARRDEYSTRSTINTGIPIASRDAPRPAVDYTNSELQSTDYTVGLRYAPAESIALRASFGTGFLPPSVTQIASQVFFEGSTDLGLFDHRRGDDDLGVSGVPFTFLIAGNPNLKPERSRSFSAGVILTPQFAPDLRLSVDYTRIRKDDEIQSIFDWQYFLDNEDKFPDRIVRGPKLLTDPANYAGPIILFDATDLNIAETSVESYDIQADYTMTTRSRGVFHWYAIGTLQPHFESRLFPTDPMLDKSGFFDGPLKWRFNAGITWDRGPLSLGWNAQYFHTYLLSYSDPALQFLGDEQIANQGASSIRSQMYHDVAATYRFDDAGGRLLANTEILVGIQNLFGKEPPILASTSTTNPGYSPYGDPRLRRYTISVRKSFQ